MPKAVPSQLYSTRDTEEASFLIYCGCYIVSIDRIPDDLSVINLSCPNGMLTQWLANFRSSSGDAMVARGMFKAYKALLRAIKEEK